MSAPYHDAEELRASSRASSQTFLSFSAQETRRDVDEKHGQIR